MTVLYYDPIDRVAISDDPFLPDEEGIALPSSSEGESVCVDEWKTYYVRAYGENDPAYLTAEPFYAKPFHGRVFEINFRNYVGLSRIGHINLRVANKKISDSLYDSMLGYVSDKYADLIFSFNRSVGLKYEKDEAGEDILYIQLLFLKRYLLDGTPGLDEIAGLISARPHRRIATEIRQSPIDEIDQFDLGLCLGLFSGRGKMSLLASGHRLLSSPLAQMINRRTGGNHYPSEAMKLRKLNTFDTNENRFVKHFLKELLRKLDSIDDALGATHGSYLNPDTGESTRLLRQKIRYFLSDPLWAEVGEMNRIPAQSTVLQRRDGYRHLFRLYSLLQLVTRYQFGFRDFRNLIEIKDVPTLFEYWCFFLVKDILDRKFKQKGISIIVPPSAKEQVVQEGVEIAYEGRISLLYNAGFSGSVGIDPKHTRMNGYQSSESYSHSLRPDIVIIRGDGRKLVLDAKYKGKGGGGLYGSEEEGTIRECKDEDLDKMHSYRDAIKGVYGAFALYPGEKSAIFPSHWAKRPFEGVGALAFRPVAGGRPGSEDTARIEKAIDDFTCAA